MYIEKPTIITVNLENEEWNTIQNCIKVLHNMNKVAETWDCEVFETLYGDTFSTDTISETIRQLELLGDINEMH